MVNTEQFGNRLQKMLEYYDLSAASFADKIEVGRSSISHILSGRNKPSLDFVMKVVKNFPEVELYWLLNGKGTFPPKPTSVEKENIPKAIKEDISQKYPTVNTDPFEKKKIPVENMGSVHRKIKRIVFFYEDGSFEAFEN